VKTVFTNRQCAHVWAQFRQPHGRAGSMRFDGAVAYSYREPVAHALIRPDGSRIVLFTSRNWSVTTSDHVREYRSALPGHVPTFIVPDLLLDHAHTAGVPPGCAGHARNRKHFESAYETERAVLMRCPADSWRVRNLTEDSDGALRASEHPTRAHRVLAELAARADEYATVFGLDWPAIDWRADADKAIARRDRILNDPKRATKLAAAAEQRRAAEARKAAELAEKYRERLAEWLDGAPGYFNYVDPVTGSAYLRVVAAGAVVQTSRGAEAPLPHVLRALKLWEAVVRANDLPWVRGERASDDSASRLGHFTLDRIDADGGVHAGCHYFSRAEIERFALALARAHINDKE
jgi:hypothetical protein